MIRAVVFDMFETLISHYRAPLYFGAQISSDMGLPEARFREIWNATEPDRTTGKLTFEAVMERILRRDGRYSPALLERISRRRLETKRECFRHLHREILPMLEALREHGLQIALISNCFSEEVVAIRESCLFPFFDAALLSYEQGVKKPDPEIYRRCLLALRREPSECLYVGDGGSRELEAAEEAGMKALQAVWYFPDNGRDPASEAGRFPQLVSPSEVLSHAGVT